MRIFQTCFFIIEIIFWLLIGLVIALSPERLFGPKKDVTQEKHKYNCLESPSKGKRWDISKVNRWKVIWFIFVMGITIYFLKPNFLDIPQLVTGKLNYVTGKVMLVGGGKTLSEYVYLSTGEEFEFFLSSGVSVNDFYKIGYLSHTNKAIYCEKIVLDGNNKKAGKVIGFPFKDILLSLAIIGAAYFLAFISPLIKLKVFIPTNIIAIPIFLYYFIKYGVQNGIWFSIKNPGVFCLIMNITFPLIIFYMYLHEKQKSNHFFNTYLCAQLVSICEIVALICIVFNLN